MVEAHFMHDQMTSDGAYRELAARFERYVAGHLGGSIYNGAAADELGVCPRTLHTAVVRAFGLSPQQFVRFARLNSVRAALARGSANVSIKTVAASCGFTHLGEFARLYRKAFGERPSETAKAARGRPLCSR